MTKVTVVEQSTKISYIEEIANLSKVKIYRIVFKSYRPAIFMEGVDENGRTYWFSSDDSFGQYDAPITNVKFEFPEAEFWSSIVSISNDRIAEIVLYNDLVHPELVWNSSK